MREHLKNAKSERTLKKRKEEKTMENNAVNNENQPVDTQQVETTPVDTQGAKEPTLAELKEQILKLEAESKAKDLQNQKLKASFDRASSEAAKYKKDFQAKLTDEEMKKIEQEEQQQEREKEFAEMKSKLATIEATKRYIAFGFDEKQAEECAKAEIGNDMDSILKSIKGLQEANIKKMKAEWLNERPEPQIGGDIESEEDPFVKGFKMGSK